MSRPGPVARWLVPLLLLGGLLLMHGVGAHGTHESMDMPAAATGHGDHSGHAGAEAPDVVPAVAGPEVASTPAGSAGAMTMCVAILVGLGLVAASRRRTTGGVLVPSLAAALGTDVPRRGRDPDPPCLVALSVHRC